MTGVILRCPNCGTSTTTAGECEACHEADVRFYCTNHKPGHWLNAPACPQCGAKFGDPERPSTPSAPSAAHTRPLDPSRKAAPRKAMPPPPLETGAGPWERKERPRSGRPDLGTATPDSASAGDIRTAKMVEILRSLSRSARVSRRPTYRDPEAPTVRVAAGGCLLRFVLLMLFLFIMLPLMLSLIGGSLLGMLGDYYYY
jgi:hypothetical protein